MRSDRDFGVAPLFDEIGLAEENADGVDTFGLKTGEGADVVAVEGLFDIRAFGGFFVEAKHECFVFCAGFLHG